MDRQTTDRRCLCNNLICLCVTCHQLYAPSHTVYMHAVTQLIWILELEHERSRRERATTQFCSYWLDDISSTLVLLPFRFHFHIAESYPETPPFEVDGVIWSGHFIKGALNPFSNEQIYLHTKFWNTFEVAECVMKCSPRNTAPNNGSI